MILESVLPWEARYMKGLREVVGNFVPSCKEPLKGIYKFRVGSYRILCEKRSEALVIIVVKVGDRKEIYKFNQ